MHYKKYKTTAIYFCCWFFQFSVKLNFWKNWRWESAQISHGAYLISEDACHPADFAKYHQFQTAFLQFFWLILVLISCLIIIMSEKPIIIKDVSFWNGWYLTYLACISAGVEKKKYNWGMSLIILSICVCIRNFKAFWALLIRRHQLHFSFLWFLHLSISTLA